MENNQNFFIGVDLGWKDKKTTGICVLKGEKIVLRKDVYGRNVIGAIKDYLKDVKTIAVDAPLTLGRGKGKMRLFEKFLSTEKFRREKINLIPPAVMAKLWESAECLSERLHEKGFLLGANLIETSVFLIKRIIREDFMEGSDKPETENEESSFICAKVAFLHSCGKTGYIGYKDGFLFLPRPDFWKEEWQKKINKEWTNRDRLRYHYLKTDFFKDAS